MPLFIVFRPAGREDLLNAAGIHGAVVAAADEPAAIAAANALAPDLNTPFAGYTAVQAADTAAAGFTGALIQGDIVGSAYSGPRRGA